MVYIGFKTFRNNQLLSFRWTLLRFRATIRYRSYTAIMDTSLEMQIQ